MPDLANTPAVVLSGIRKSYGEHEVLHGVSLIANEGDVISILGSSGSGKSTLLRCINMLEVPNAGSVSIHGETIALDQKPGQQPRARDNAQVNRLRAKAAMVFQSFNLWSHLTILENLIEAPVHVLKRDRKDAIAEAETLLARVGIAEKRHAYPAHLSGGQQQRAAIARALAMHPSVMLFDEPTSALDPELVGEVLKVMRDLAAEGRTMLIVTHEMGFARDVSTRTVFLHNGVIEEEGLPSEVFRNPRSERFRQFISRDEREAR
ncbi:ABC transporter ATP-binding protein [Tianweitania sp.]|uniref:ABC transporter ATP-binding protein n=1 Tax=Tianweitania sp. TaxID=2021634 RepID=UPI00289B8265|nr:ATP-binding cassette domain-containing protein [Tianweitania sp.]